MASILAWLLDKVFLASLWNKIVSLIESYLAQRQINQEIDDAIKKDIENLKNAKTDQDKTDVARDLAGHI